MQAGLSALKTPQSYSSTSNKEDPLSTEVSALLTSHCTSSLPKVSAVRFQVSSSPDAV